MKLLLALLLFASTLFAQDNGESGLLQVAALSPTWSFIAEAMYRGCSTASSSCNVPASTTTGQLVVVNVYTDASTEHAVTVSGGGVTSWSFCPSQSCAIWNSDTGGEDIVWGVVNSSSTTPITVTLNQSTNGAWLVGVGVWSCTANCGSGIVLDAIATPSNLSSCTTCSAAAFTSLSGTNDLLIQGTNWYNTPSSPSAPYTWDTDQTFEYALGSTQLTAPTTTGGGGHGFQANGLAFKVAP